MNAATALSPRLGRASRDRSPHPPRPAEPPRSRRLVRSGSSGVAITFACLAMLVCYLPFSGVNGVLGAIGHSTGANTADLQWVTDAFTVALAGSVLSGGILGARYGRARVTLAGIALTAVGSVVGFTAGGVSRLDAVHVLWVAQAIAGIGGGLVMSASLELIVAVAASTTQRAQAIGLWAGANVVALGAGPFLSGWLTEWTGWRWLYLPVLVLALATIACGVIAADRSRDERSSRLDWGGQLTATAGIVALVYGVIHAGSAGWSSPPTMVAIAIGLLLLVAFLAVEQRSANPAIEPRLFLSPGFGAAGVAAMAVLFAVIGTVFVLSLYFAHRGTSGVGIALRLGALFAGNGLASVLAPRLQARLSPRVVLVCGLLIAAAGQTTLLTIGDGTGLGGAAWRLVLTGVGCGLVMATATAVAVQSVPGRFAGTAGAANNAVRQIGGALGTAVIGGIFARRLAATATYISAVHTCSAVLIGVLLAAAVLAAGLLFRGGPQRVAMSD